MARLAVRNEALIGQILACPKCGSMVLVEPPGAATGGADATPTEPTSGAAAKPTPAVEQSSPVTPAAPAATPAVEKSVEKPVADPGGELGGDAGGFDDLPTALDEGVDAASALTNNTGVDVASTAAPAEATAAETASRSLLWIIGGATLGAAVVAGAMLLLTGGGDDPVAANTAAAPATSPDATLDPPPDVPPTSDVAPQSEPPNSDRDAPVVEDDAAAELVQDDPLAEIDEPAAELPDDPFANETLRDEPPVDAPAAEPTAPIPAAGGDAEPADDQPRMIIGGGRPGELDPLSVDPEGLSLSALLSGPAPLTPREDEAVAAADEPAPDQPREQPVPPALRVDPATQVVRRDPGGSPPGAPANVAAALEIRLPAVEVKKMPLCRFLDFVTKLSAAPVSVSPEQLQLAAVASGDPVSVELQDAKLEDVLAEALKPLRLAPLAADDQIILQRNKLPQRRTIDYPVGDLATGGVTPANVAEWIEQFAAPEAWESAGGDARITPAGDKLSIDAPEPVQYETLLLLERIRQARKLPLKSRYPARLVAGESPYAALAERLGAPATFTFTDYAPLRAIFRHWQEETEVAVLVDWPALSLAGLWPPTRIACSQHGVPWGEAMDAVLEPLDLGWRAVDGRTIQITTLDSIQADPQSIVLSGVSAAALDAARQRLSADARTRLTVLAVGDGVWISRATAPVQRQLAAELQGAN